MKFYLFLLLFSVQLLAKDLYVTGKVIDSDTKTPLPSANVLFYHLPDSTMKGTITSKKGTFRSDNLNPGKYMVTIKFIGYFNFNKEITLTDKPIDIGTIELAPGNLSTEEITVIGKMPLASQSGDTTVYNADAFKVNKDAVAQDLLKKVPGIQMENGKLKAQGEEVKKVLIDGKNYMGDDPNAALKNLPAEVIERIQVFDQQSEQSQFTGFNDGNTQKAINLITRLKVHEGTFGRLFGGYGTDKRYGAGGIYNYFNNSQRISLIGQINNTNDQSFTEIDMLGVMGSGTGGGQMRFRGRGNDFFSGARNGDITTKAFGINYNDLYFEKMESGSSYFFNNTKSSLGSVLKRDYFNDGTTYNENSRSLNTNLNHRFNMLMNYSIDSMNSLRFIPGFSYQKNNSSSVTNGLTNINSSPLNYSNSLNSSDLSAMNFNGLLMFRHRFNNDGRSFSLSVNGSLRNNKGNRKLFSESVFYNAVTQSDTIDQYADINNDGHSLQTDLTYNEPIGESSMLSFNGSYSVSRDKNDKETFNLSGITNSYSLFDTLLSNVYTKRYVNRAGGAGFRYRMNKLSFNANLSYNIATLTSEQEFPRIYQVKRNFYSFQPSLRMQYDISRDKNLSLQYRTMANAPSANQLQNVIDNSNPLQLTTGNPNLKQEFMHSASLRLSTTNFNDMSTFFMMFGGTFKENNIGTATLIARRDTMLPSGVMLNSGSQLTYPENYNGYMSLQSFMTYGLPVDFISSTINLNANANYTRNPGNLNRLYNVAKTMNYGLGATISSNISTEIDFTINSTSSLNTIRNSASKMSDQDYFSQETSLRFYWLAFERLTFNTDFTHRYIQGISNPTSMLLNVNLGLKVFENRKGEFKFSVYDALNQNNNNTKTTTDIYTQEYSSNLIGRYYLLTFTYNISTFN